MFMAEYRRRLPHFHPDNAHLFVTWRLWGSLLRASSHPAATPGRVFVANDRLLDCASGGAVWLREPAIAACVARTLNWVITNATFMS